MNLEEIVKEFIAYDETIRKSGETAYGASGQCNYSTMMLRTWFQKHHKELDTETIYLSYTGEIYAGEKRDIKRGVLPNRYYGDFNEDCCFYHTVLRVGNKVVDLTAKQYKESLPFPLIYSFSEIKYLS